MKHLLTTLLSFLILPSTIFASTKNEIEMADALYQSGKIYVVVCVLAVIFVGIVIYLINLDRKIRKLEKEQN